MRLLLDTHAFLWFVWDDPHLSATAQAQIIDPANQLLLSVASAWEIAIKVGAFKLEVGADVQSFFDQTLYSNGIEPLPIQLRHVISTSQLPMHHRDPFDRVIIAQAITDGLSIVTSDQQFKNYSAPVIW